MRFCCLGTITGGQCIKHRPFHERAVLFATRLAFRGIYFPQRNARVWTKLIAENRRPILRLLKEGYGKYKEGRRTAAPVPAIN